jgi:hypothetical protein
VIAALVCACASVGLAGPARAAKKKAPIGERAALIAVDLAPGVAPGVRPFVERGAVEGLAATGYAVIGPARAAAVLAAAGVPECRKGPCLRTAADALGVDALVLASVSGDGGNFLVRLVLVDRAGAIVAHFEERCDLCGLHELQERTGLAASALRAAAASARTPSGGALAGRGLAARRASTLLGLTLAAGGLAALGVAAGAGLALQHVQRTYDSAPNESLEELRALDRLAERGRTWALVANVSIAAGAAAVLAGAALLLVPRLVRSARADPAAAPPPLITLRAGPLGLELSF